MYIMAMHFRDRSEAFTTEVTELLLVVLVLLVASAAIAGADVL